ncbi:REP-associated tyrosine transposase [Neptuniibacter sp. QD34_54]|uniref:REP-associated tyrosine transposase n=1 Tax=Neptuniibacter sp. QD34_54 TaxID=3398208 RepID=UPI0039F4C514
MKKGNSSNLRKGRFSEEGRVYLVTFATDKRQKVFTDLYLVRILVNCLKFQAKRCDTLAYVVMPDHVHWLVQLNSTELSTIVHSVKSYSAKAINAYSGRQGAVWQNGFHDHALRDEEDLVDLARYVVLNPIRAGLASKVGDYSHWDAVWI